MEISARKPVFPRVLESEVLTGLETNWKGKERKAWGRKS